MPVCGSDSSHKVSEWWRRNELGRWYQCDTCGTTMLSPSLRFRIIIFGVRLRRLLRRRWQNMAA